MPFYDFYCKETDDLWEDAFFGKFEDIPETLEKDGNVYKYKESYTTADTVFKGIGWTDNSKVVYMKPEDKAYLKQVKNQKNDLQKRKEKLVKKLKGK